MQMGVDISFEDFINQLNLNFATYIEFLCNRLTKPILFLKRHMKDIKTSAYEIKATTLWEANTDIQFILDPYTTKSYCTSYLKTFNKTITNEFQTIIKKCENENFDANLKVRKLNNVFLNAQQMSTELTTYMVLSLPPYHTSRSFSFLNTSPSSERVFILKSNKKLKELLPNSIDIKAKFVIDKYLEHLETLYNLTLSEFVAY
jgi:hypothetical protein